MLSKWFVIPMLLIAITASVFLVYGGKRYSNYYLSPWARSPQSINGLKRTWFFCDRCLHGGKCDTEDIINCKTKTLPDRNTALDAAAGGANIEAVRFLVDVAKADVNGTVRDSDRSPLMSAAYYGTKKHQEVAAFLLLRGANINATRNTRPFDTALLTAIWKNNLDFAKFLIDNGADPSVTSKGKIEGDACKYAIKIGRNEFIPIIPGCEEFKKNHPELHQVAEYKEIL